MINTIYVAYDRLECNTIAAAESMDEAIAHVMRYMMVQEYECKEFSYDESFTIIEFQHDYRIGPGMHHVEGTISIMQTNFFKADE